MATKKKPVGGAYLLRDAPSDVVRGRPSRPPRSSAPPEDPSRATTPPPPGYVESGFPEPDTGSHSILGALRSGRVPGPPPLPADLPPPPPTDVESLEEPERASETHRRIRAGQKTLRRIERVRPTEIDALGAPSVEPPPPNALRSRLHELMTSAPGTESLVVDRFLAIPGGLQAAAQSFPGPLWFDRRLPYRKLPPGRHVSAIAAMLVVAADDAAPYVEWLLGHSDEDIRFYALLVAAEVPQPSYTMPIARLVLDGNAGVRQAARHALAGHRTAPGFNDALTNIRDLCQLPKVRQVWKLRAMKALAELGDAESAPMLVETLGDGDRAIARAAHNALCELTCQDFGSMRLPWRRWLKAHGRQHRVAWLIDALADRREELRLGAWTQLVQLSGLDCGLSDLSDREAFIAAQAEYARWWRTR